MKFRHLTLVKHVREVFNLKSICWIYDNYSTVLTQFKKKKIH